MDYKEDEIRLIVKNVANNQEGFKFLDILLDKLGAFERGCNFQNHDIEMFNKGKREQGQWLLDLLRDSNFEKFIEIENLRRTVLCQNKQKTQD